MWQWIAASLNQGPVEKKIEGQAKGKRRATFSNAIISEVKFDDFDANASKKAMQVTVTVVPKQIVTAGEAAKSTPQSAAKRWSPANFRVKVGGIPLAKVNKIESFTIKQKVTESGKAAYEVTDMRIKLDTADAKTFADALAKDKSAPLVIALTSDDDTVWRTLTVTGLKIQPTQASGGGGDIIIKGKNIAIN